MKCPFCGDSDTQVINSRVTDEGDAIRRRRKCGACDKRFNTFETAELMLPMVVKTNGTREAFDENKLRCSFSRALHKRPVPTEYVYQAIARISQQLLAMGEREVPARFLGEQVMHALKQMDKVAYIRFASVYRSFSDVDDFNTVIKDL